MARTAARLDLPRRAGPAGQVPRSSDVRRAAAAVLRWRAWRLGHGHPWKVARAARLLPALFHASFAVPGLSQDAPGVSGLRYHRRWSTLARELGLPPPKGVQRGRCLVEALVAIPGPTGLDLLVLPAAGAAPTELGPAQERIEAVQRTLARDGLAVRAALYGAARLERDLVMAQRAILFGALLAGVPGDGAWRALEAAGRAPPERGLPGAAAAAPTPFSTLALTLLSGEPGPGPLPALVALLASGASARELADADAFALGWGRRIPSLRPLLEEARALACRPAPGPVDLSRALELGRALAVAAALAVRKCERGERRRLRRWRASLGPGIPLLLLPALRDGLRRAGAAGDLKLDPVRVGRCYEVRAPGGAILGRGRGPVQARVRALGVVAQACGEAAAEIPAVAALDPTWRAVVQRLAQPREEPAQVLLVEAGAGSPAGPPHDPLNRGDARAIDFEGVLQISIAPGRRASGRLLSAAEGVVALVHLSLGEQPLEVLSSRPEARPVAVRLSRIAALLRDPRVPAPLVIEAGGFAYAPRLGRLRRWSVGRFAARPRRFTPDPECPDLALSPGERTPRRVSGARMVQCRVTLHRDRAAILYADAERGHLREVVPIVELEDRLRESRAVVRAAHPTAVLTVRLSDGVEQAMRQAGSHRPAAAVAVRGALPRVEVEVAGERYGSPGGAGWDAAAEAVLAAVPPGREGFVGVSSVAVTAGGEPAAPLLSLWAASVARRRLRTRMIRAARLIGSPRRDERPGEGER